MLTESSRNRDFPSLAGHSYLNTAAEGIPPLQVRAALDQYFQDAQMGMDGRIPHLAERERLQARTAAFYGLSPDEIGICSCSSEAFNLAALALDLQVGDEVIITDLDFPAGATPWLQPWCPATVKLWRARAGGLRVEDLIPLLSSNTRLVTASLVSFYNGYMLPLPAVTSAIRIHSPALLALDVTQALGRVPLHLDDVDLIVSSTHKWILGSHGGGLVGVPTRHAETWTVAAGGWYHLQNAFDQDRFERAVSKPGADSFGTGMPNYPAIYAVSAGLDYIQQVSVDAIDQAARPLVHACLAGLKKLPVEVITPDDDETLAGIVALRHPDLDAVQRQLHAENIHVMAQAGRMRIAIHGYNTIHDIEKLLAVLGRTLQN